MKPYIRRIHQLASSLYSNNKTAILLLYQWQKFVEKWVKFLPMGPFFVQFSLLIKSENKMEKQMWPSQFFFNLLPIKSAVLLFFQSSKRNGKFVALVCLFSK